MNRTRRWWRLLLTGLLVVHVTGGPSAALLSIESAGRPTTRLSGVLRDATGGVIPGGAVELRALGAGVSQSTVTDADGRFSFDTLAPGRYVVTATAPGFGRSQREIVVIATDRTASIDITLDVQHVLMAVEVAAPEPTRPLVVQADARAPRQPVPAHDGAEYLRTIPGFSVIRKGGTDGDPVLRGMAGSRLGVLLDGETILGGCGNRMDPPTAYVFPAAYDRITVLKGPQTVRHGPGNSAGVVLFERTRDRYDAPRYSIYASPTFGAFGRNDQAAEIKGGTPRAYGAVSATRSAADDYQDGRGDAVHSSYERWSTNALVGWTPGPSTRIELSGAVSDGHAAYADRTMDGVMFARENASLRIEQRDLSPTVRSLEGQLFYNYVDHVMDNYSLRPFTPSTMMPAPSVNNPDRSTVGGRASADLQFSSRAAAMLGIDWQANRHRIRATSNQVTVPFESLARARDASFDTVGAFGDLTIGLGASARVVTGARADWWTGDDARQVTTVRAGPIVSKHPNPTAGLQRHEVLASGFARYERDLASGTTLYAGLGHSRRAPDYWELVSKESAPTLSAFQTRPEKTTQLDAGALFRTGALSGSLSMFANRVDDLILIESGYPKALTGMGGVLVQRKATIARNIDAWSWGGEAGLAWAMTSLVRVDASVAYVRGENDTDRLPLAQLPPLEGRVGLQWAAARWSLGALARVVAAQERYALNQGNIVGQDLGPTAGFGVFSVNGTWRLARFAFLSAGVDNVLDTSYAEFVSRGGADVPGFTTTTRVNEPGRTAWIKLDLKK